MTSVSMRVLTYQPRRCRQLPQRPIFHSATRRSPLSLLSTLSLSTATRPSPSRLQRLTLRFRISVTPARLLPHLLLTPLPSRPFLRRRPASIPSRRQLLQRHFECHRPRTRPPFPTNLNFQCPPSRRRSRRGISVPFRRWGGRVLCLFPLARLRPRPRPRPRPCPRPRPQRSMTTGLVLPLQISMLEREQALLSTQPSGLSSKRFRVVQCTRQRPQRPRETRPLRSGMGRGGRCHQNCFIIKTHAVKQQRCENLPPLARFACYSNGDPPPYAHRSAEFSTLQL